MLAIELFNGLQRHWAEEAAISWRPIGSIEGTVIHVHDIDVFENFPVYTAAVEVANAIGGHAGDFHVEDVAGGFEIIHHHAKRRRDKCAVVLSVQRHPRALANVAEVENVRLEFTL